MFYRLLSINYICTIKSIKMKKLLIAAILLVSLAATVTSCGASKRGTGCPSVAQ
jgi:hypothetical protein